MRGCHVICRRQVAPDGAIEGGAEEAQEVSEEGRRQFKTVKKKKRTREGIHIECGFWARIEP